MKRAAVWFARDGALHWFCFTPFRDAQYVAKRLMVTFGVPAVVLPYDWEPEPWQRRIGKQQVA